MPFEDLIDEWHSVKWSDGMLLEWGVGGLGDFETEMREHGMVLPKLFAAFMGENRFAALVDASYRIKPPEAQGAYIFSHVGWVEKDKHFDGAGTLDNGFGPALLAHADWPEAIRKQAVVWSDGLWAFDDKPNAPVFACLVFLPGSGDEPDTHLVRNDGTTQRLEGVFDQDEGVLSFGSWSV